MPPKTRNSQVLLAYCRDRLEQITQEIDLLKDIIELMEARGSSAGHHRRERDGGDEG